MENELDIPYQFIEEIKDLLLEYEDQNLDILFKIISYVDFYIIYDYYFSNNHQKVNKDTYYDDNIEYVLISYKKRNIPLNRFLFRIEINEDRELSMKFINRLKQFYPNIKTDITTNDIIGLNNDSISRKLNNNPDLSFILFILE